MERIRNMKDSYGNPVTRWTERNGRISQVIPTPRVAATPPPTAPIVRAADESALCKRDGCIWPNHDFNPYTGVCKRCQSIATTTREAWRHRTAGDAAGRAAVEDCSGH